MYELNKINCKLALCSYEIEYFIINSSAKENPSRVNIYIYIYIYIIIIRDNNNK